MRWLRRFRRRQGMGSGLRPEFRRAYLRMVFGPWWHPRRWFKWGPDPAYVQRVHDALEGRAPHPFYGPHYLDPPRVFYRDAPMPRACTHVWHTGHVLSVRCPSCGMHAKDAQE